MKIFIYCDLGTDGRNGRVMILITILYINCFYQLLRLIICGTRCPDFPSNLILAAWSNISNWDKPRNGSKTSFTFVFFLNWPWLAYSLASIRTVRYLQCNQECSTNLNFEQILHGRWCSRYALTGWLIFFNIFLLIYERNTTRLTVKHKQTILALNHLWYRQVISRVSHSMFKRVKPEIQVRYC